jgi:uncharacterized membrane protein YphA (DoxX/SURF4 family)
MAVSRSIHGRSYLFNVLSIVLSLIGLSTLCTAFLPMNVNSFWLFFSVGTVLLLLGTLGVIVFQGKLMFSHVARVISGTILIVSGLVKLNDPIGFSFKLEEYFQDGALAYRFKTLLGDPTFSLQWFQDIALELAISMAVLEVLIGVLLLLGLASRFASITFLVLMFFFTFLTWHTATCDVNSRFVDRNQYDIGSEKAQDLIKNDKKDNTYCVVETNSYFVLVDEWRHPQCVTDCGCFGDAMKSAMGRSLMPIESLLKDLLLLFLAIWIVLAQTLTKPNGRPENFFYFFTSLFLFSGLAFLFSWVFLGVFSVLLLLSAMWIQRFSKKGLDTGWGVGIWVILVLTGMTTYVLLYDPVKDFRPFSIGTDLKSKMNDGRPSKSSFLFVLFNKKSGTYEEYNEKEYTNNPSLWDEKTYKFISRKEKVMDPGMLPSITDQFDPYVASEFLGDTHHWKVINDSVVNRKVKQYIFHYSPTEKRDTVSEKTAIKRFKNPNFRFVREFTRAKDKKAIYLKNALLQAPEVVLLCAEKLHSANWNSLVEMKQLAAFCKKAEIPFILLTSSSSSEIKTFVKNKQLDVLVLQNDSKGMQMISRSSPALLVLKKGTVRAKYVHRNLPSTQELKKVVGKK